jgi:hypothetical protein
MSHTITNEKAANIALTQTFTIINYVNGTGETFTLAENGLANGSVPVPVFQPSLNNSLGVLIWPVVIGSALRLYQFSGGAFVEIPTTNNLNAVFQSALLVSGSQLSAN